MVTNIAEYSVSEISFALKKTIETSYARVKVRGEISGYRGQHSSGHAYFALKDDRSKLDIVIWRSTFSRLANRPEEGMEVIAVGKLSSYPGSSRYQLILESLEPAGIGALMKMLEQRREKLASEGLFADERKQRLPFIPNTIGIITSPTGAVIRDILHRLQDRYPLRVILWPARMQGDDSARQVTRASKMFKLFFVRSVN